VFGSLATPVSAQGVQTGTLRGTVVDQQALSVPNVVVTVSSPALQGDRLTRTGGDGMYVFRALPPGDYTVSFEMTGFTTIQRAAEVPLGGTVELHVALQAAGLAEEVQVVAAGPADEPVVGLNIRQNEIDALPTSRTLSGIASLAPNLNENAPNASSGQVVISGAFAFDNMFMVNGVDVNDNIFGNPQSLFIEDAIAETQVLTSGISAEYGRFSGGVVNAITKSGGNTFSGSYRVNLTNPDWVAETPFEVENDVEHESDLSTTQEMTLGGPVAVDRLWFFAAGRLASVSTAGVFDQTGVPYVQRDRNRRGEIKVTGTAAPNHTLQFGYLNNFSETVDRPSFDFSIDPSTLYTEQRPNWYAFGNYRGVFGSGLLAELQYTRRRFRFEGAGGRDSNLVNSPMFTAVELGFGAYHYNAPYFDANDVEQRNNQQLTGNLTGFVERGGRHEIKGGYEFYQSQLAGGGGQSATGYVFYADYARDEAGTPLRDAQGFLIPTFVPFVNEYDNWRAVKGAVLDINTTSLFVQDRWTINRHVTADLGLRYERASSEATGGRTGVDTSALNPRLALTFDPSGTGRYEFASTYGHYSGRYNEGQISANVNVGQPNVLFAFYVGPEGQGRDFAPGFDPANYVIYFGRFPTANVSFEEGLSSPVTREFTLSGGANGSRGFFEVTYVWRDMSEFIDDFITLSNGVTTVVEEGVTLGTFTNSVYRNTNLADRKYQSVVVTGRIRPTSAWTLDGAWTIQLKNEGNYNGEATNQPALVSVIGDFPEAFSEMRHYPTGRLPSYQRHRAQLWTIYDVGMGRAGNLSLSGLVRMNSPRVYSLVATGLEITEEQAARIADYPDTPVGQDVYFGARGSESFKGYATLDAAVNYNIPVWQSVRPWIKFEVFNLLNNAKQVAWSTTVFPDPDGPTDALGLPTRYIEGPDFGEATSNAHFPTARTFRISGGLRF
jgi:hypothetical protein